ncbi:serine/threonine-protein kinase [Actinomadura parmotrematis]|uniref:Serine/threonine protein kinase n=1 Tax=Actinomadura parmotrematis TaxID=2864039 RepID=A0ABS7G4A7_9ACTN|nr:serine/threonine-protein kinase [Actinomadura parmotrematis]MBW8487544.1 serine/threonine protein kinase [Actinomadura parmotrematis]
MEVGTLRPGDPETLGPYTLIGRIGEGGQGSVLLAEDEAGRQVAVKLLHPELTADDKARSRFLRELEVAKRVAPFCTAQVIDADVDGDRPYIVSEYVRGPSLNQLVTAEGPLAGAALERLAVGTATALAAIHQGGIIHRDFKPHNVLIGPDGPRVIDFGVARAVSGDTTLTSKVIGTPSYMAPEQIQGEPSGPPADVFCWAATLVFAATGEPPYGQDTIPAVINRILHEEPDLGGMTGPLRDLVADCLEKDPAVRPKARTLLMRLLGHEDTTGGQRVYAAPAAAPAETAIDGRAAAASLHGDDATAMLAAGSELAADLGDEELRAAESRAVRSLDLDEPSTTGTVAVAPAGGAAAEPPSPREWAAENTLPPDATAAPAAARRAGLAGLAARPAALAGAAALIVVAVIASTVLALTSASGDKPTKQVSDPRQSLPAGSRAPEAQVTHRRSQVPGTDPTASAFPTEGTASPTASPSASATPTPTAAPTTRRPTQGPTQAPPTSAPPVSPPPSTPDTPPTTEPADPGGGTGAGTDGTTAQDAGH